MDRETFLSVVEYVFGTVYDYYDVSRRTEVCPFASFEEAYEAYQKHQKRVLLKNEPTKHEIWMDKIIPYQIKLGIRKLRRRRGVRLKRGE